ncbi:MAG: molybdopterin molybdotransferase MoeA [Flavobacteriaceae bacterium]|nr:molybdopterin molybdotransferase MoeA [Flavobacteriaceae bacterium]
MISYSDAIKIIENQSVNLKDFLLPINDCLGYTLSRDIYSPIDFPPFSQSAMDGYAIKFSDIKSFKVVAESKAGKANNINLNAGEAIRIFTGAYVSSGVDAIVIQEKVTLFKKNIIIDEIPRKNQNIRFKGEQIKKGDLILSKGSIINPASIGYILSLGINKLPVYKKPSVAIIVSGDELVSVGVNLDEGKIYESNSSMIKACLYKEGIMDIKIVKVKDNLDQTVKTIQNQIKNSDVVIVSGGISVGDYDFVRDAMKKNDVKEVFYKVNQKPGKPIWFGRKKNKIIFALPGNPGSTLTCFYIYVLPILRKIQGRKCIHLDKIRLKIDQNLENNFKKTLFLKGRVNFENVLSLKAQSSAKLSSFSLCDTLIYIPEKKGKISKNDKVDCFLLPK